MTMLVPRNSADLDMDVGPPAREKRDVVPHFCAGSSKIQARKRPRHGRGPRYQVHLRSVQHPQRSEHHTVYRGVFSVRRGASGVLNSGTALSHQVARVKLIEAVVDLSEPPKRQARDRHHPSAA